MRWKCIYIFICSLAWLNTNLLAANSVETKFTWGPDFLGYRAGASADLDPAGDWNSYISYSRDLFTDPAASGWSNLFFLELSYFAAESLLLSANFSYSLDSDRTSSLGPGLSLFYMQLSPAAGPGGDSPEGAATDAFTVGFESQVTFYQAELESADSLAPARKVTLTQASPTLFADVALIPGRLNANASGSYLFYSDDPTQIAANVDPDLTTSGISALSSLMAGLLWSSWQTGLSLALPGPVMLEADYGRQLQVYPAGWVSDTGLSLSAKPADFLKTKITWRRYFFTTGSDDLFSAGLRFDF